MNNVDGSKQEPHACTEFGQCGSPWLHAGSEAQQQSTVVSSFFKLMFHSIRPGSKEESVFLVFVTGIANGQGPRTAPM